MGTVAGGALSITGEPGREEDARPFRTALGHFPTGVAVVTARSRAGEDLGMTISSFNTVSLRPPLVLFCVDRRSHGLPAWVEATGCAVNILAEGQDWLATQFAKALDDKWANVRFARGHEGAPLLEHCTAQFECRPYAQHDGGDHVIFVVEVVRYHVHPSPGPLVFCKGRYNNLRQGSMAPPDWPLPIHY